MPIRAPIHTFNFGDILRYFKYNMSSGIMIATIERAVQRELMNRKDFPTRLFFGAIGVGIMIFIIIIAGIVFLQTAPSFTPPPPAPPNMYG